MEWRHNHVNEINRIVKEYLPSGCGFDNGSSFDLLKSTRNKLVITTSFHHMDDNGTYDGWTDHQVIVTPDLLSGFHIEVTGENRNQIKDFIADTFDDALSTLR